MLEVISMSFDKSVRIRINRPGMTTETGKWLLLVIVNMVIVGVSQCLVIIPAHSPNWNDPLHLRVPIFISFCALIQWIIALKIKTVPFRRVWRVSAVWTILAVIFYLLVFNSLDRMSAVNLSAIVFPIITGTCILLFSLYSAFILRERFKPLAVIELFLSFTGIFFLALK